MKNFIINLFRKYNFRGKGRLINLFFKDGENIVIPYHNNTLIEINTSELIGWHVFWMGGYENDVMWVLNKILEPDDVAIDCGANLGVWSIVLARKCNFVHLIEPHPDFRIKLENNLVINRFANTHIYPYAISQREGYTTLFSPPFEMKNKSASIVDLNKELSEHIKVEVKSLDTLFLSLPKLNFIKIDCDGSDGDIIMSGRKTIVKHLPYILFEDLGGYHNAMGDPLIKEKVNHAYDDAFNFLYSLNYRIFEINNNSLIESKRIYGRYSNMLAFPPKI